MALSHKHVESKILAKINTNMLTRAELLITLCYEIPCIHIFLLQTSISTNNVAHYKRQVWALHMALNIISTFTNATPVPGGKKSALYVPRYVTQAQDMMWFTMVTWNHTLVIAEEINHARHWLQEPHYQIQTM